MKIAVVDHVSAGGVSRFAANLIDALRTRPDVELVSYFVAASNIVRDGLDARWLGVDNVVLHPIEGAMDRELAWSVSTPARVWRLAASTLRGLPPLYSVARWFSRHFLKRAVFPGTDAPWYQYALSSEVKAALDQHDVVYIAWPYFLEPIDLKRPIVATFHDFHFMRFPEAYAPDQLALAKRQTPVWLSKVAVAVTSTDFVSSEIDTYFDVTPHRREVVYLAPYTTAAADSPDAAALLENLGVRRPYVIYSGSLSAHKNVLRLLQACRAVSGPDGTRPMLVVTGIGTQVLGKGLSPDGSAAAQIEAYIIKEGLKEGEDYLALGYVDEDTVDELTRAADLVVSASLYEAGCGPALDAWRLGAPVAFSNIPPFMEQMHHFGVEAYVFDPADTLDISRAIRAALTNKHESREMARRSQQGILQYTWNEVAAGYMVAFRAALAGSAHGTSGMSSG
ncbi:MAG: glycosyltransferase [Coriobacteriia bacterium]